MFNFLLSAAMEVAVRAGKILLAYWLFTTALLFAQQDSGRTQSLSFRSVIDLTHTLDASTPTFEEAKEPAYRTKTVATIEKDHYFAREVCLPEHFGTHLDAPAHFALGRWMSDRKSRRTRTIDCPRKTSPPGSKRTGKYSLARWSWPARDGNRAGVRSEITATPIRKASCTFPATLSKRRSC